MKNIYNIEVAILQLGQSSPYADSEYSYIVTYIGGNARYKEDFVKEFCTKFLYKCNKPITDPQRMWYETYYSFKVEKIEDDKIVCKYTVVSPYCD